MDHTSRTQNIPHLEIGPQERLKPDGVMAPAAEAGWFLQREREARGLTLDQASHAIGIHPYHLEAIEFGDMTGMPSRAEALEMIAAYAGHLGFEPEPLVEHYLSFLPVPQVAPRRHPAMPAPLSSAKVLSFGRFVKLPPLNMRLPSMPGGNGGIVASVVTAFVLFSGLAWLAVPGEEPGQATEQVASAIAEPTDPMPTASTGQEAADVRVTETPMAGEALATLSDEVEPADAPQLDPDIMGAFIQKNVDGDGAIGSSPAKPKQTASQGPGRVFGSDAAEVRVTLKAMRSIWLLIEDGKGNRVATQLLNKGDIYRVPDRPGLVATVQDGGAVKYLIDGVEKGVLGEPGSVLAAEPLDVKKLEARGT